MKTSVFSLILLLALAGSVSAAEIRLKSEAVHCTQTLVLLGDVAEIVSEAGDDAEALRRTVLFAAPRAGEEKTVSTIELRNVLSRLGVRSTDHRLTGSQNVVLVGGTAATQSFVAQASATIPAAAPVFQANYRSGNISVSKTEPYRIAGKKAVTPQFVRELEKQVAEALGAYLDHACLDLATGDTASNTAWNISLKLTTDQARTLASNGQITEIFGGSAPFTGKQQFTIQLERTDAATGRPIAVAVETEVSRKHQVVVIRRTLPRGYIIGESDVMLSAVDQVKGEDFFVDPAEVVGMETATSIRERSVLTPSMVKKPLWVRKGDVVTVWSVNGGVRVRVNGNALQDGTQGETISIEMIRDTTASQTVRGVRRTTRNDKQAAPTILARVSGPKTVEVFATSAVVVR